MRKQEIDFFIQTIASLKPPVIKSLTEYLNQLTGLDAKRLKKIIASTTQATSRKDFICQLLNLSPQERSKLLEVISQGESAKKIKELSGKIPEQAEAFNRATAQTAAKIDAWVAKKRKKSRFARLAQKFVR